MKLQTLSFLAALALAAPVHAAGVLYDCDITKRNKKVDWISAKLAVVLPAQGEAKVVDRVILNFFPGPIAVDKLRKRGNVLSAVWRLKGVTDKSGQKVPDFRYEAKIDTVKKTVHLSAKPNGYPNRWTGRGTCTVKTAK